MTSQKFPLLNNPWPDKYSLWFEKIEKKITSNMQCGGGRKRGNYVHISHSILDFLGKEKNNNFVVQKTGESFVRYAKISPPIQI